MEAERAFPDDISRYLRLIACGTSTNALCLHTFLELILHDYAAVGFAFSHLHVFVFVEVQ